MKNHNIICNDNLILNNIIEYNKTDPIKEILYQDSKLLNLLSYKNIK